MLRVSKIKSEYPKPKKIIHISTDTLKIIGKVTNNFPKKAYFCIDIFLPITTMKITIVSGARPNFMKIAPICRAIDAAREAGKNISYRIVYTGPQDDTSLDACLLYTSPSPRD